MAPVCESKVVNSDSSCQPEHEVNEAMQRDVASVRISGEFTFRHDSRWTHTGAEAISFLDHNFANWRIKNFFKRYSAENL